MTQTAFTYAAQTVSAIAPLCGGQQESLAVIDDAAASRPTESWQATTYETAPACTAGTASAASESSCMSCPSVLREPQALFQSAEAERPAQRLAVEELENYLLASNKGSFQPTAGTRHGMSLVIREFEKGCWPCAQQVRIVRLLRDAGMLDEAGLKWLRRCILQLNKEHRQSDTQMDILTQLLYRLCDECDVNGQLLSSSAKVAAAYLYFAFAMNDWETLWQDDMMHAIGGLRDNSIQDELKRRLPDAVDEMKARGWLAREQSELLLQIVANVSHPHVALFYLPDELCALDKHQWPRSMQRETLLNLTARRSNGNGPFAGLKECVSAISRAGLSLQMQNEIVSAIVRGPSAAADTSLVFIRVARAAEKAKKGKLDTSIIHARCMGSARRR